MRKKTTTERINAILKRMDMDTFQQHALQSVAITDKNIAALAHRSLGISGEAGILTNQIKRIIRDKNGIADENDIELIKERIGDVLYYSAVLADYYNLSLSSVAKLNMEHSSAFKKARSEQD